MAAPSKRKNGALAFLEHEAAGGAILLLASLMAVLAANTALAVYYSAFLDTPVVVQVGALKIAKPLLLWINDGLMAIFFFLVALEIKREMVVGELSSLDRAMLPAIAAVGGMVVPAMVYTAFNFRNATAMEGWAIPTATDIAFAVALLATLGSRVPATLKVFLLALAIIDDLGAIVIIALFYTDNLSVTSLWLAIAGIGVLIALNRGGVNVMAPYLLTGIFIWVCVLKSGVHATLAGVIVGFAIPLGRGEAESQGLLQRTEHALHPWVAFGVLPLFAFANAGVSLAGFTLGKLAESVPLGIALGLMIGKPLGITGAVWLAVRLGIARLPEGANWMQILGVAAVAGIGFTMSLFIGTLAFPDGDRAADVRLGVILGSLVSALAGYLILAQNPVRASDKPTPLR